MWQYSDIANVLVPGAYCCMNRKVMKYTQTCFMCYEVYSTLYLVQYTYKYRQNVFSAESKNRSAYLSSPMFNLFFDVIPPDDEAGLSETGFVGTGLVGAGLASAGLVGTGLVDAGLLLTLLLLIEIRCFVLDKQWTLVKCLFTLLLCPPEQGMTVPLKRHDESAKQ